MRTGSSQTVAHITYDLVSGKTFFPDFRVQRTGQWSLLSGPLYLLHWRVRGEQVLWLDDRVTINITNLGQRCRRGARM